MNRNTEAYFSELPKADIQRSTFDRSSGVKFTCNVGDLIPFYVDEVLPGDTFKVQTSKVVRLQTLLAPIMDNVYLDVYYFYVPNRLVWEHWKEFMGENTQSAWLDPVQYSIPQFSSATGVDVGSIADYLGVPPLVPNILVSALPFRAYALIWNEFFRPEFIADPLNIYKGDATRNYLPTIKDQYQPEYGEQCRWPFKVSRYHDYFSSCLPSPQHGPDTLIPGFGNNELAPVVTGDLIPGFNESKTPAVYSEASSSSYNQYSMYRNDSRQALLGSDSTATAWNPVNLWADLGADTLATINNLRLAFQIQKFYERENYGTRYIEMIKSHFGVTSSDARLQRPEYLGGNRIPLVIHQVTNNAQSEQDFLGDLGAMSLTSDIHYDFVKSFEEHGLVIGVCCVRYDHTYSQGLDKMWTRKNRFDFYFPEFANISNQPVMKSEIFVSDFAVESEEVFGYNEAFADYRQKASRVCSEMRPSVPNNLSSWNLADNYSEAPTLSPGWLFEDRTNVDRALAVTSAVSNQVLCDFYIENICTRPMPFHSIPGLADHH